MNFLSRSIQALTSVLMLLAFAVPTLAPTTAHAQTASAPRELTNGTAITSLAVAQGDKGYFKFTVPAGASRVDFVISGNNGDADLYVRYGALPSLTQWDYRPYSGNSNESVTVNNPQAGVWYVMVDAYRSFNGLTLKATHNASAAALVATPVFSPAPGTFSGQVSVTLASSTAGAVVRYTTNGSAPTSASEVVVGPIQLTATTELRAAAFAANMTTSAVAVGTFTIRDTVQTLVDNSAVSGLSGASNSVTNFKLAVPRGTAKLVVVMSGGSGNADLYVKYGQLATTSVWDQRPFRQSNNETVTINTPQAGDYFVMLHGYAAYSQVTLKATLTLGTVVPPGKPDLVVSAADLNPRITTETFGPNACEIQEGTITAGTKKLLRFNTTTRNIGTADLVLGNPANNPSFTYGSCHGHYHFTSFAQYRLLGTAGNVVRTGKKVGFCLMDITRVNTAANPNPRYTCSNQGIQAGWADIYDSSLSGQWIDITGLPSGAYVLEITLDPMNVIDELNESNNTTRANVTIP
jgi:Lysyl oxidase/Bacterial pre-peptidase C-terminal domain/Chitobiase/beta-hexosaminidase C-terminal domain